MGWVGEAMISRAGIPGPASRSLPGRSPARRAARFSGRAVPDGASSGEPRAAVAIRNNPNQQPDPTFRVPDVVPRSAGAAVAVGEFFDLLRRRLGSLLLVLAVTLLAAFGLLSTATKTFQAKAYVKVAPVVSSGDAGAAKDISTITESAW